MWTCGKTLNRKIMDVLSHKSETRGLVKRYTPPRFPHRGVGPALGGGAPIHNEKRGAGKDRASDVASASMLRVNVLLLAVLAVDGATEYTMDTFDAAREGKSAFVKFLAPW